MQRKSTLRRSRRTVSASWGPVPSKKINTFLDKFNEVVAQDMAEQRASAKRTLSRAPDYRVPPPAKEKKPEPEASGLAKGVPPATTNWHHLMKAYDAAQLVAPRDFFEVRKQVDAAGCKLGLPVVNVPATPMTASEADEARVSDHGQPVQGPAAHAAARDRVRRQ